MLRISIKNDNGIETNAATFATEAEVSEWYKYNEDYFPKPHTKVLTSLVDEALKLQRQQESKDALELGFDTMAKIRSINRRKIKTAVWDQTKFNLLLTNPIAAKVERALWNGSLSTAAYLIINLSDFYSDIEIQEIVIELNSHETKWSHLI